MARRGFDYQDHVAAAFCIDMLLDDEITAVWCETLDDITVLRRSGSNENAEFVQVKGGDPANLWSVARLCARERHKGEAVPGTSVLERSLAHDRCCEPCTFRLVTTSAVQDPLALLCQPRPGEARRNDAPAFQVLAEETAKRVGDFRSPAKNDHRFWLLQCLWEVRASTEDLAYRNLLALERALERQSLILFSDQRLELYERLLRKVRMAATATWATDPAAKKIVREDLQDWLAKATQKALHPGLGRMRAKLTDARLDGGRIEAAVEQRQAYLEVSLNQPFLAFPGNRRVADEVQAVLVRERARLDAGSTAIDGPTFHAQCVEALGRLHGENAMTSAVGLSFILGCMYDLTNRCLHRFCEPAA